MARFYVGAALDRVPSPRYFEGGVSHVELALHGFPRAATAKKMVVGLPPGASLAVQLPASFVRSPSGALRHEPAAEKEMLAAIAALAPRFLVLVSGVDLTPGPRDREALERFAARLQEAGAPQLVWQAGGPWEAEQAIAFAQKLGVVPAVDPFEPAVFEGPVCYARVRAIGVHARLGDGTLARIAESLLTVGSAETWVTLEAGEGPRRARRLAQILAGESSGDGEDEVDDDDGDDDE